MIGLTMPERYLMRRTFRGIMVLGLASYALTVSIDFLEALRQVSDAEGAGTGDALALTFLRTPQLLMVLSPFVILFGTLLAFAQLARSLEVAVFRAAGFSVWRIVGAPVLLALAIGLFLITIVDPVTTEMAKEADQRLTEYKGRASLEERAFGEGLWLRQDIVGGDILLIRAGGVDLPNERFTDVTLWRKSPDGRLIDRFDGPVAELTERELFLTEASRMAPGEDRSELAGGVRFPTTFSLADIRRTSQRPEVLNLWNLPGLMQRIDGAGIPTEPYAQRLHEIYAVPLKLAAMAVIACVFALPIHARSGGIGRLVVSGIAAGFLSFILIQFSQALGEAGLIPVIIAAWTPPLITLLAGLSLLLFREDG
ncbi:LptF/LptG family permease [Parvularcula maris]|uniref:LptF/LptG family permease n=1 Tax=Parvularcula maris TaxID=2965077 RepID=A0A9X2L9V8_9PROT|nr:LptF/LptG family permease [Parvularcula maris]MCQ8185593.1 LptF/LptG family permease [Parvularcula maris]